MAMPNLEAGSEPHHPTSEVLSPAAYQAPASLYLHIPFCLAKCSYCDFASYPLAAEWYSPYIEALTAEIRTVGAHWGRPNLDTIYLGGGTPTVFPAELLAHLLATVNETFHLAPQAEVTIEANPGTVTPGLFSVLRAVGVTRLSLGVQSFQAPFLRLLGRIHTAEQAAEAVRLARASGLDNINMDLIYALPGQTLPDWQRDLDAALALEPQHLSLYALSLEPGTPLATRVSCSELPAPDDEKAAAMYKEAEQRLGEAGFCHYEISNWGLAHRGQATFAPPLWSRHNLNYWLNLPYAGCGAAAHSWVEGRRLGNVRTPREYIDRIAGERSPVVESEEISPELERAETMFLGLRLTAGVSRACFAARFGVDPLQLYPQAINETVALGLLELAGDHIRLTDRGRLLGNEVFWRFLP